MVEAKNKPAAAAQPQKYCYNISPDPQWIIRCDVDPQTGKCTSNNCVRIKASEVPDGRTVTQKKIGVKNMVAMLTRGQPEDE